MLNAKSAFEKPVRLARIANYVCKMGLISSSNVFNASLIPVSTTSFVSEPFAASVIYGPLSMP